MTKVYNNKNISYGLNQPLNLGAPEPIVASRAPTANDHAQIGQTWVVPSDDAVYTLTSIVANTATWSNSSGGGAIVDSITVTTGPNSIRGVTNINTTGASATTIGTGGTGAVNLGNATGGTNITGDMSTTGDAGIGGLLDVTTSITAGTNITTTIGDFIATVGGLTVAGDIESSGGNLDIAGTIDAGSAITTNTTITAGAGISSLTNGITAASGDITAVANDIVANQGDIIADQGNITATLGDVTAGGSITSANNITATLGDIEATAGAVAAGTTVTAGTTITAGTGLTVTAGNLTTTAGDLRSGGDIELLGAGGAIVSQPGPIITFGTTAPVGAAPKGSVYIYTGGTGVNDRMYINTDGMTGWTAVVTVA